MLHKPGNVIPLQSHLLFRTIPIASFFRTIPIASSPTEKHQAWSWSSDLQPETSHGLARGGCVNPNRPRALKAQASLNPHQLRGPMDLGLHTWPSVKRATQGQQVLINNCRLVCPLTSTWALPALVGTASAFSCLTLRQDIRKARGGRVSDGGLGLGFGCGGS